MKKLLFGFLIGTVFLLSSCTNVDTTTDIDTDTSNTETTINTTAGTDTGTETTGVELPELELVGDAILVIKLGETFIDPGVNIIGDFTLDVLVANTVDVNTIGEYSVTYTIEYNQVEYSITRSVLVVDTTVLDFDISISNVIVDGGAGSVSFSVTITDENSILIETTVAIYQGATLVDSQVVISGTTLLSFDGFLANTTYRIDLEGTYQTTDGVQTLTGYTTEFTTPEVTVVTPDLTLVGKTDVYVEVYETFVDEGVDVSMLGYDVTTVTTVDAMTVGDYTVTYSIEYNEETISVVRNVHVYDYMMLLSELNITFTYSDITENSIDAQVIIGDLNGYLSDVKIVLTSNSTLVTEYDLEDDTEFFFTGLIEETVYELALTGTYDNGEISGDLLGYSYTITTDVNPEPTVELISEEIYPTEYSASILVTDPKSVISVVTANIYKNGDLYYAEDLIIGSNDFDVLGYEANATYRLEVVYIYTNAELTTDTETVVLSEFTSQAIPTPTVMSDSYTPQTNDISCLLELDTTGFSNITLYYNVYVGELLIKQVQATGGSVDMLIDGLVDGTEYTIEITATYLSEIYDTTYYFQVIKSSTVTTIDIVSFTTPTVNNVTMVSSFNETDQLVLNLSFDLDDPDNTVEGTPYMIIGYGTNTRTVNVAVGHNEIVLDEYYIDPNIAYNFLIKGHYAESEEVSVYHQVLISYDYTSPVQLLVDGFTASGTFFEGDNVILALELENSEEVNVEYVTINGTQYSSFVFPSNNNMVYIDMGVESTAGNITYNLTEVAVQLIDDSTFIVPVIETQTVEVYTAGSFVADNATITVLEITTDDHTILIVEDVDKYIDIYIHIENDYNLPITKIRINGTDYFPEDFALANNIITISVLASYNSSFGVYDLEFARNTETVDADLGGLTKLQIYTYESSDIVQISTVEQFLDMREDASRYFLLMNDLDFTGYTVNPLGTYSESFRGCFDGNGYTLSNITMTTTVTNQLEATHFGLFGYSNAYLYDITINNIDIVVNSDGTSPLFVGALAGTSEYVIYYCEVTGGSSITINGIVEGYIGGIAGYINANSRGLYAEISIAIDALEIPDGSQFTFTLSTGGLIGYSTQNVDKSYSTGSISLINVLEGIYRTGGLVGVTGTNTDTDIYISNSYSTVDIDVENLYLSSTGGLLGEANNHSFVKNCYASGTVTSNAGDVGGLVGSNYGKIYNSFATGDVFVMTTSAGRIVGNGSDFGSGHAIFDTFKYDGQVLTRDGTIDEYGSDSYQHFMLTASDAEYNDSAFYYNHLLWSDYFFDFATLDVVNGVLPILK